MNVFPFSDRDPIAVAFGRVLRTARREAGLTRNELAVTVAATLDYPRFYFTSVETGLQSPSISELFAIAAAIKADPAELIRRTVFALPDCDAKGDQS